MMKTYFCLRRESDAFYFAAACVAFIGFCFLLMFWLTPDGL